MKWYETWKEFQLHLKIWKTLMTCCFSTLSGNFEKLEKLDEIFLKKKCIFGRYRLQNTRQKQFGIKVIHDHSKKVWMFENYKNFMQHSSGWVYFTWNFILIKIVTNSSIFLEENRRTLSPTHFHRDGFLVSLLRCAYYLQKSLENWGIKEKTMRYPAAYIYQKIFHKR